MQSQKSAVGSKARHRMCSRQFDLISKRMALAVCVARPRLCLPHFVTMLRVANQGVTFLRWTPDEFMAAIADGSIVAIVVGNPMEKHAEVEATEMAKSADTMGVNASEFFSTEGTLKAVVLRTEKMVVCG